MEKFHERSNNVLTQAALNQLQRDPGRAGALGRSRRPTTTCWPRRRSTGTRRTNHTLFARFAYQDQSSPNDQIPVPATADLNNGNTNTTTNYDFVASHTWTLARRTG